MVAPAAHTDPVDAADAEGRRCVRCNYSLIGLPRDGACPECGTPVAQSAAPVDMLRNQDPAWIARLAEAFLWQIGASLVGLAVYPVSLLTAAQAETESGRPQFPLSTAHYLLYLLLDWCAGWWLSTPEPQVVEPTLSLRRCLRVVVTLTALSLAAATLITFQSVPAWAVATLAAAVLPLAAVVLWYLYVHRLALRLPSPGLAFQILLLLCGIAIGTFFTHTLPWLAPVLEGTAVDLGDVDRFTSLPGLIIYAALGLYAIYLWFRLRARLVRVRDESAALRAAEEPSATGV